MEMSERLIAEIESARPQEIILFGSQRRRIRAYMRRLNREPIFENDQVDPLNEEDLVTTIGGLIDTALGEVERQAGLVSDAFGNLRSLR